MNHYQDQTKKKPLIQYHKMKYNQPTIVIKDKIKKEKSVQKQNNYEPQTKKIKDFNHSKYATQYHQNQNNIQMYKKPNPTGQGLPLTPSNIQVNNNISNMNKNLTFGIVKNTQKNYMSTINNQPQLSNPNHIISVNVNIQNLQGNMMQYKKSLPTKYDIKPLNLNAKRNIQNQRNIPSNLQNNQRPMNNLKLDDDKRRINNTLTNVAQRHIERNSILDRGNAQRNIQRNDRNQKKEKFKKQYQEKFNMTTSPVVDKDFLCQEELDIRPMDKKPTLYEKKLSEKKLSVPQLNQHTQINIRGQLPNHQTLNQNPPMMNQPSCLMNLMNQPSNLMNQPSNLMNQPSNPMNQARYAKKIDKKATEVKQLRQFQAKQEEINSIQCSQAINVLFQQQQKYMVNPTYLQRSQKTINWTVRAILIDWMRQLSHQYALKRDTYHLAVVLLDNFLARKANVQKQVAQVIGATTLFIASKLQELQCRPSESFAESTQGICTAKDIQTWEIEICRTLMFSLNPPTTCSLANRIMTQWDKYVDEVDYALHHPCFQGKDKVFFKKLDQSSYKVFRQLMQFIDCIVLDIQTAQYKPILIVLSLMYLIIGIKVAGFQYDQIHQVFPRVSHYLLDRSNYFNDLFQHFVASTFGLTLLQILPSVQYTASYFNLNLTYEKPLLGQNQDQLEQMDLQEYCSYQTYNRHMLKTVTSRFRGIMSAF